MISFAAASHSQQTALLIFWLFTLLGQEVLFLVRCDRLGFLRCLPDILLLLLGIVCLASLNDLHFMGKMAYFAFLADTALVFIWIAGILILCGCCCGMVYEYMLYHKIPTRRSIKESFDDMPSAICFFNENGLPVLCNKLMYNLAYALTGRDLQSEAEISAALADPSPGNGVERLEQAADIYRFPDGRIWSFSRKTVPCRNKVYTQIMAIDVKELYEKTRELEANNEELARMSEKMGMLIKNISAIAREEEVLAMKMRVHDDIGRSVIASRRFLLNNGSMEDVAPVIDLWYNAVSLLKHDNDTPPDEDALSQLISRAKGIGIEIIINGQLPQNKEAAYLLITAMRECATNAVRHADADVLQVTVSCNAKAAEAVITNNGNQPAEEISEGGGLTSLRRRIERAGGQMLLQSTPRFTLTVTVPLKEELL